MEMTRKCMRMIRIADGNVLTRDEGVRAKKEGRLVIVDPGFDSSQRPSGRALGLQAYEPLT